MGLKTLAAAALIVGLAGAGTWGTWRYVQRDEGSTCSACRRPIHAYSRTVATENGDQRTFCCPACALSERAQSHGRVSVMQLTDYPTLQPIAPSRAVLVRGSDVSPCAVHATDLGDDKHTLQAVYDRCAPSLIAFAQRDAAVAFARQHGGEVVPYSDVARDAQ